MGNHLSDLGGDDDEPVYDYHKKVLNEFSHDDTHEVASPSRSVNEEEQYFSAEDGDSEKSLTPLRDRPESSSGEELSESDAVEDEDGDDGGTVTHPSPNVNSSQRSQKLMSMKSCGQCNVSTFQEYDSISPELEVVRQTINKSGNVSKNMSANSTPSPSRTSTRTPKVSPMASPFKPITQDTMDTPPSDKSLIKEDNAEKSFRHAVSANNQRKRLGYFDSSDSDVDDEPLETDFKTVCKKGRKKSAVVSHLAKNSRQKVQQQVIEDAQDELTYSEAIPKTRSQRIINRTRNKEQNREVLISLATDENNVGDHSIKVARSSCHCCVPGHKNVSVQEEASAQEALVSKDQLKSSKIGSRHIKNEHGKVVPITQVGQVFVFETDVAKANTSPLVQPKPANLPSQNSAFVTSLPGTTRQTHTSNSSSGAEDKNDGESISPFKNIVLTPTKLSSNDCLRPRISGVANLELSNLNYDDNDMEIDDRNDSNLLIRSPHNQSPKQNSISAAKKFKSFWSEKKKNLSSNLKTFFSKSLSQTTSPNARSQQSFFSHSSKSLNTSAARSPVNTVTTYLCSNSKQRSFVSSSPQDNTLHFSARSIASLQHNSTINLQNMSPIAPCKPQTSSAHQQKTLNSPANSFLTESTTTDTSSLKNSEDEIEEILTIDIKPNSSPDEVLNFLLADSLVVHIKVGDLSEQTTVGIVNWTDNGLTHTITKCSQKIAAKAGALMRAACKDYIENKGSELEAPDVLTTPSGGQFHKSVEALLHVAAPHWTGGAEGPNKQALLEVYANCLRFADERLGLESLSFPLIGEGTFPVDICIEAFFDSLLVYLGEHSMQSPPNLTFIQLLTLDPNVAQFAADFLLPRLNQDSLHFSPPVLQSSTYVADASSTNMRAPSGRPRIKRPRL